MNQLFGIVEFVQVARELFSFQLDERAMNTDAMFYATNVETSELPSLPQVMNSVISTKFFLTSVTYVLYCIVLITGSELLF
jgi:hypothetical protein